MRPATWLVLTLSLCSGCAHAGPQGDSEADLLKSARLQRHGARINELEHYIRLVDGAEYARLRAVLESSQDNELLVLCQELAGEHGFSGERESIRQVVERVADYRTQHSGNSAISDSKLDECIRSLVVRE